jgi:predicted Holliday junction resolvase-like endonuclease
VSAGQLIAKLKGSNFYAECPCGEEFKLSDAILFDGTGPFPEEAWGIRAQLSDALMNRELDLKKKEKLATHHAEIVTKAVNIGRNLERALPTLKDFKWVVPDSKFLGDPLDLLVFNGLSMGNVTSISFVEVKSGNAHLNGHQKSIRDAVEDHKVSFQVFK